MLKQVKVVLCVGAVAMEVEAVKLQAWLGPEDTDLRDSIYRPGDDSVPGEGDQLAAGGGAQAAAPAASLVDNGDVSPD